MELKKIKISEIFPCKKNARKNKDAVEAVAKSIEQCSYVAPIIIDENNEILAGHTRYKALKRLGYTECECVVVSNLSEEQKRKYRLLDNKTSELSEWDFSLLLTELEGLDFGDLELDWGVDLTPAVEIKKVELKPYKKVHYLISADINDNDMVLEVLNKLEGRGGVEIESTLN